MSSNASREIVTTEMTLKRKYERMEDDLHKNMQWYGDQKNVTATVTRKYEMAAYLALMDSLPEFKRFAHLCGVHVTPRNVKETKRYMMMCPEKFLPFCESSDAVRFGPKNTA